MEIREPQAADWREILAVANASVAGVADAGEQEEWMRNRRAGGPGPHQFHLVCVEGDAIVGYAAAESAGETSDEYRLFVVTETDRLDSVGTAMWSEIDKYLGRVGARRSWFLEYVGCMDLLAFARARGYRKARGFRIDDGAEVVIYSRAHELRGAGGET